MYINLSLQATFFFIFFILWSYGTYFSWQFEHWLYILVWKGHSLSGHFWLDMTKFSHMISNISYCLMLKDYHASHLLISTFFYLLKGCENFTCLWCVYQSEVLLLLNDLEKSLPKLEWFPSFLNILRGTFTIPARWESS